MCVLCVSDKDNVINSTESRSDIWINTQPQYACNYASCGPSITTTVTSKLLCLLLFMFDTAFHSFKSAKLHQIII